MAHDQVLKQCRQHLTDKYPNLNQVSGEGDLLDTATAAKALAEGKLSKELFILGNPLIADLYGLETVDTNLQDLQNNLTTFLMVSR
jgi:prephenate dehydratase